MTDLTERLDQATERGDLLRSSRENIDRLLAGSAGPLAEQVIDELVTGGHWGELNDRFFKTLAFGTGGLRGRTIGRVVTRVEQGRGGPHGRPEFPCVGTATMNDYNVSRAVQGLIAYVRSQWQEATRPKLVFAHDTRHFSREFAELAARVTVELGCDAVLFEAARSTPQLSFAVRELRAAAGVVLTASHNPPHDNGFKAYFSDGAQIVEPQASGIIAAVQAVESEIYEPLPEAERGSLTTLGEAEDRRYMSKLKSLLMRPERLRGQAAKVVFTNLHGTGGHITVPMLRELGFEVITVAEQDERDGRFPTVESPNPENAAALQMGVELAEAVGAEIVIGTDPDSDRMGVVARDGAGEMRLLTGNQIGSLMCWYRAKTAFEIGWIHEADRARAVIVKTYVTTQLQEAIAARYGLSVVNTLTGFKYIAAKLGKYEQAIPAQRLGGDYRDLDEASTRALRLECSRFFLFGGEESYGYLGGDFVRDKDANGAAVMCAEVAAYAKSVGTTLPDLLDEIYGEYGYHEERGRSLVMEGADGAARIQALAASYGDEPPTELDGVAVERVRDFARQTIFDEEGDELPKEKMLFVELRDGRALAVRPSGTEPKIKFYLFGKARPGQPLAEAKAAVGAGLDALWTAIEDDVTSRLK